MALSPWFGVNESPTRQRLWTFAEDTSRMVTAGDRMTLTLLARTLTENTGIGKASVWGLARLIGALRPVPQSGDAKWDALAKANFNASAYSPRIFDAGGRWTFDTFQIYSTAARRRDGDIFAILTETAEGRARISVRESHCVASPPGAKTEEWNDGVRVDKNTFPLAYAFRGKRREDYRILPYQSVHHFAEWINEGSARGVTAFTHALNHLRDRTETFGFFKSAIKIAAMMGLSPKNAGGPLSMGGGIGSGLDEDPFAAPADPSTGEAREERKVSVETMLGGGIVAPEPYETLVDSRPHPNVIAFNDELLKEIAIGFGVSPEVLFYLRGASGPEARIDLDSFAKFVFNEYAFHLIPFCQRFYTYHIAKEIKAGRLPVPDGEFWKVAWAPPRSLSADLSKMGKLSIDLVQRRMMSFRGWFEQFGLYWKDEFKNMAEEIAELDALESEFGFRPGRLSDALRISGQAPSPEEIAAAAAAPSAE